MLHAGPTLEPSCTFLSHCSAVTSPGHEWSPRGYHEQLEGWASPLLSSPQTEQISPKPPWLGATDPWLAMALAIKLKWQRQAQEMFPHKNKFNKKGKSPPHVTLLVACTLRRQESVYHSQEKRGTEMLRNLPKLQTESAERRKQNCTSDSRVLCTRRSICFPKYSCCSCLWRNFKIPFPFLYLAFSAPKPRFLFLSSTSRILHS